MRNLLSITNFVRPHLTAVAIVTGFTVVLDALPQLVGSMFLFAAITTAVHYNARSRSFLPKDRAMPRKHGAENSWRARRSGGCGNAGRAVIAVPLRVTATKPTERERDRSFHDAIAKEHFG